MLYKHSLTEECSRGSSFSNGGENQRCRDPEAEVRELREELSGISFLQENRQVHDKTVVGCRVTENVPRPVAGEWTTSVTVVPGGTWYATAKNGRTRLEPKVEHMHRSCDSETPVPH